MEQPEPETVLDISLVDVRIELGASTTKTGFIKKMRFGMSHLH